MYSTHVVGWTANLQVKVIQRLLEGPPDSAHDGSPDHPKLEGTAVYTIDKFQV